MEKDCRMAILLNYMDISRLMVYAQQIEESKIRDIRQEGKRPMFDESSPNKRFYHQDSSMENKNIVSNQNSGRGPYFREV